MKEDEYNTLFTNPAAQTNLKANALQMVNEWYCQAILDKSEHAELSQEAIDMIALVKQVPLC